MKCRQRKRRPRPLHLSIMLAAIVMIMFTGSATASLASIPQPRVPLDDSQSPLLKEVVSRKDMFLPFAVKPTHYDLTLEPLPENSTYRGHVEITLEVKDNTKSIVLHADNLTISSSCVRASSMQYVSSIPHRSPFDNHREQTPSLIHDTSSQTITFNVNHTLAAGSTASLSIEFTGNIRHDLSGLFASPFTRADGSNGSLLMTSMAPTYARRTFPCFDEPALKASFSITVIADETLTVISNTAVDSIDPGEAGKAIVKFQPTPPMSTYLVACVIGELSYIENTESRVPIRIYTSPGDDAELTRYAAHIVARGLTFYENLFELEYPLPKLDLVAAPTFLQGGMENWGIIIAHSTFFPYDPDVDGEDKKDLIARLLLHELAHQWFGNIVTLEWWDQTWLNEGGATEVTSQLEPDWTLSEHRQLGGLSGAFGIDAYRSSHPIEIPVYGPDEIIQVFDQITYSKGALVLKMIRQYLTPETFYAGIAQYLKAHAYGNAKTSDLWEALSDVSGREVSTLLDPWTKNVGYPFIRVSEARSMVSLEQHRFLFTGDPSPSEDETIWPIFLGMRTSQGVNDTVFDRRTDSVTVEDDFYILNANYTYLYRTHYPEDRLQKLVHAARDGRLTTEERAGLISDTCALAHAGYHRTSTCLGFIQSLHEQDPLPWSEIIEQFTAILAAWLDDAQIHSALQSLYRDMAAPLSHQLGWNFSSGSGHAEQQFKAMLFTEAGKAGDKKILQAARVMFNQFAAGDETALHQMLQRGVFEMMLLHGEAEDYDAIVRYIRTCRSQYSRRVGLQALLVTENASLVQRTLDAILSGDFNPSDASLILGDMSRSLTARNMVWAWARDNWSQLKTYFPDAVGIRNRLAQSATRHLTSRKQLDELKRLMRDEDIRGVESELELSLEYVRGVVNWVERDTDDLRDFLGLEEDDMA